MLLEKLEPYPVKMVVQDFLSSKSPVDRGVFVNALSVTAATGGESSQKKCTGLGFSGVFVSRPVSSLP